MVISTIYFKHYMAPSSYVSLVLVFGTVFYSIKRQRDMHIAKGMGTKHSQPAVTSSAGAPVKINP